MTIQITLLSFSIRYFFSIVFSMVIVVFLTVSVSLMYNLWGAFNVIERGSVVVISLILLCLSYHKLFNK